MKDPLAAPLLEPIPEARRFTTWHLIRFDGETVARGAAGVELLESLECARAVGRLLRTLRLSWLIGLVYWAVSTNRRRLGLLVSDRAGPRRFP